MPTVRRVFLLALLLLLAPPAADALAQAGGGSSGFGGGGGGGGGSSGGGGSYGGGGGSGGGGTLGWQGWAVLIAFGAVMAAMRELGVRLWIARTIARIREALAELRYRRRRGKRAARVQAAAAEAADDDPAFAADAVREEGKRLFLEAQQAWDRRDTRRLRQIVAPELMVEWARRLKDFKGKGWHNRVKVLDDPRVDYVGLVNRERDDEDRAVVRIVAKLRSYVVTRSGRKVRRKGELDDEIMVREYWTLAKRDGRWTLASIEQAAEGEHHLDGAIVATPWSDEARLSDETVTELAVADGLPEGFKPADVADLDFDGDARAAALDLALADGRFAPDVLEAAARRAVEAWAEAVDGEDAPLHAVASPEATAQLLHGEDASGGTRLVVRGPAVKRIHIAALDAGRDPATMTIEVQLGGRRYMEDRDTAAVLSGSKDSATTFTERWTLALDGAEQHPWRIVETAVTAR